MPSHLAIRLETRLSLIHSFILSMRYAVGRGVDMQTSGAPNGREVIRPCRAGYDHLGWVSSGWIADFA